MRQNRQSDGICVLPAASERASLVSESSCYENADSASARAPIREHDSTSRLTRRSGARGPLDSPRRYGIATASSAPIVFGPAASESEPAPAKAARTSASRSLKMPEATIRPRDELVAERLRQLHQERRDQVRENEIEGDSPLGTLHVARGSVESGR